MTQAFRIIDMAYGPSLGWLINCREIGTNDTYTAAGEGLEDALRQAGEHFNSAAEKRTRG